MNLLQVAATRRDQAAATVVVTGVSADQVLDKIKTKVGHAGLQSLQLYKVLTNGRKSLDTIHAVGREEAGHALTHSSCDSAYPPKKLKIMSYQRYNRVYKTITKYRITTVYDKNFAKRKFSPISPVDVCSETLLTFS